VLGADEPSDPGTSSEAGSGVVEFVLVTVLVLFLFLVVMQVGLALHARNVLVAAAAEGARYGANADRADEDGAERALQVVAESLPGVAGSAEARAEPRVAGADPQVVDIVVSSDLPVLFLAVGPLHLTVLGHALKEGVP
jgi:Flp pilus assembly protein TadG